MPIPVDAGSALRMCPIEVQIGDLVVVMPPRSAADWITATVEFAGVMDGYLPGLLDTADREMVNDALLSGQVTYRDLVDAAQDLIAVATGFTWWWVGGRLLLVLAADWARFGAALLAQGFDFQSQPIGAALMTMYGHLTANAGQAEPEERHRFYSQLCLPPEGIAGRAALLQEVGTVVLNDLVLG